MARDVWKDRAWRAVSAMHNAALCRTAEDMRAILLQTRMELESFFVQDQNRRDSETRNKYSDAEEDEEIAALYAVDNSDK